MIRKKELMLLSCLRKNARETLTNMSKKTKIPISTIFDKLRDYETGFIQKHTSLIDFKRLGYDIRINLLIKINREKRDGFEKFVMANHSVNSVFRINNVYDYLIDAIFKNIREFHMFSYKIESFGVVEMTEHFIIDELKRESFLSDTNFIELLN